MGNEHRLYVLKIAYQVNLDALKNSEDVMVSVASHGVFLDEAGADVIILIRLLN